MQSKIISGSKCRYLNNNGWGLRLNLIEVSPLFMNISGYYSKATVLHHYQKIFKIMDERGLKIAHTTILRWVFR
jgi:hypothetical protein